MPPSLFCSIGSHETVISDDVVRYNVEQFLAALGPRRDVLILPPDFTRFHSGAGMITRFISEYYNFTQSQDASNVKEKLSQKHDIETSQSPLPSTTSPPKIQIIPALGTHAPMTQQQIRLMFGKELASKNDPSPFIVHNWSNYVVTIGHVSSEMVREATYGMVDEPWPAQLNKLVWERRIQKKNYDDSSQPAPLIISVGKVVPHEVMGMANFNNNLFVGVGGVEAINLSHFIGAVHGMEKLMGRGQNPLRSILNYASENILQSQLDLW